MHKDQEDRFMEYLRGMRMLLLEIRENLKNLSGKVDELHKRMGKLELKDEYKKLDATIDNLSKLKDSFSSPISIVGRNPPVFTDPPKK